LIRDLPSPGSDYVPRYWHDQAQEEEAMRLMVDFDENASEQEEVDAFTQLQNKKRVAAEEAR
jgi:hypothetical protein